nr:hypothetical protein [uncultured Polynucleobacter sp.]
MIKHRYYGVVIALAILLVALYGYIFPQIKYFKCDGQGIETNVAGVDKATHFTEYLIVKKYLYGYTYTLDQYKFDDCLDASNGVMCRTPDGKADLFFDFIRSNLGGKREVKIKQSNIVSEEFALNCTRISRAVD